MRAARTAGVLGAFVAPSGCGSPCTGHNLANGASGGEITSIESVVTAQKRRDIDATCQATLAAILGDASAGDAGDAGTDSIGSDDAGAAGRIVGRWGPWVSFGLPCAWPEGCLLVRTRQPYEAFVRMVRPSSPGTYALAQLQGEVCERYRNGPPELCYGWSDQNGNQTDWHCAPLAGQLTVRKIAPPCNVNEDMDSHGIACGRLDADLVLAGSVDPSASPEVSAEGNVQLVYGDTTYQTTCGGIGVYPSL